MAKVIEQEDCDEVFQEEIQLETVEKFQVEFIPGLSSPFLNSELLHYPGSAYKIWNNGQIM